MTNIKKDKPLENTIKYNEPLTKYISSKSKLKEELIKRKNSSDDDFVSEDEVKW